MLLPKVNVIVSRDPFELWLQRLCHGRHSRRPEALCNVGRVASIRLLQLRLVNIVMDLRRVRDVTEDLLGNDDRVHKSLQHLDRNLLKERSVYNKVLLRSLIVVCIQLVIGFFEHGQRQVGDAELVDVEEHDPVLALTRHQHVVVDVVADECIKLTEGSSVYQVVVQTVLQADEVEDNDGLHVLGSSMTINHAHVEQVKHSIGKTGDGIVGLAPLHVVPHEEHDLLHIEDARNYQPEKRSVIKSSVSAVDEF